MTLEERIEAGAKARYEHNGGLLWESAHPDTKRVWLDMVRDAFEAAIPGLFTNPPTGWIAPWEATRGMQAAIETEAINGPPEGWHQRLWAAARDAHLKANAPKESVDG